MEIFSVFDSLSKNTFWECLVNTGKEPRPAAKQKSRDTQADKRPRKRQDVSLGIYNDERSRRGREHFSLSVDFIQLQWNLVKTDVLFAVRSFKMQL